MQTRPRYLRKGAGFPSANRELARRAPNANDPNGYYRTLGLPPDAGEDRIRTRCRELMKIFHPDGLAPDRELFERVQEIYSVLSDPVEKAKYDHTPEGGMYVDSVVREAIRDASEKTGRPIEELLVPNDPTAGTGWTYWYEGLRDERDPEYARQWYEVLLPIASDSGYDGRIVLVLVDGPVPYRWREEVFVPRCQPSEDLAKEMFSASDCLSEPSGNV